MISRLDKFLAGLVVVAVLAANAAMSYAEEGEVIDFEQNFEKSIDPADASLNTMASSMPSISEKVTDFESENFQNLDRQDEFLDRIQREFNLSKTEYQQILSQIAETKARLTRVSGDKISLRKQLQNLDDQVKLTTGRLFDVIRDITATENEIKFIYEEIEIREIAIEYQKSLLKDYVRVIYQEENELLSFDDNGDVDAFKMLLADGTVGENLQELEYFDLLNIAGQQIVDRLDELAIELENYRVSLNSKRIKLLGLQDQIEQEKKQLELQKEAKENLLALTLGQEQIYGQLLVQTQVEQAELLEDIKQLNEAMIFVQQKIAEEGANFNPDDYMDILDNKTRALYDFYSNYVGNLDGFAWPVDPDRGISAFFRDPGYVGVFGVQHNAVDIPIYQGSPVRAAADGVVYTAKDNGYGYSYIILAHSDGFTTVYGHISSILVNEGQTVPQGTIIGLSGGMPGTKGAGYMTTGPHLHFEMKQNGTFIDPLSFLPLSKLTAAQVENLPEKYRSEWERLMIGEAVSRF
jgi:murein DD-endopeptidase MepM/ murein hydrolase activator NlpD